MSTDRLLDVFVGVRPDAQLLAATEQAIQDSVDRIRGMFGAMQNQSATAAQNAANILNGINAGRGAGGAGGGGGGNRGGRSGQTGLVPEFEQARRLAQDLQKELSVVAKFMKNIGDENLSNSLQQMQTFLDRIQTDIGRQRADRDVLGVQQSIDLLQDFRQQLNALQSRGFGSVEARRDFDTLREEARKAIFDEKVRSRLADSLIVGNPSGDLKKNILETRAVVQALERDLLRAQEGFDGTQQSVTNLGTAIAKFKVGAEGLGVLQAQAKAAGPSFNTLTNNAYQLGQAIEDFSVGYSLNGFAGGVRGAANNVAFLLNNLVQADYIQGRISEKWKNILPIAFGIGSAVAITILPPLVQWIESLNDIEVKFRNIQRAANEISLEAGIEADLNRSTDRVRDFARNATDVSEIIKKVLELRSEVGQLQSEVLGTAKAFGDQRVFKDFSANIDEFQNKIDDFFQGQKQLVLNEVPGVLRGFLPEKSALDDLTVGVQETNPQVKALRESINGVTAALADVQKQTATGIISTDSIVAASKSLRDLQALAKDAQDPSTDLAQGLELADGVAKKLDENVTVLSDALDDLAKKSREAERAQQDMADAILFSQRAVGQLLEDSRLELDSLLGIANNTAVFTRELERATERSAELQKTIQSLADRGFLDPNLAASAIASEKENTTLENRIKIQQRINETKDQLKSREEAISALNKQSLRDEQARLVTIESFAQQLQANALSSFKAEEQKEKERRDAITKEVLERQKLIDSMDRLNQAYDAAGDPDRLGRINRRADRFSVEPVGAFKGQDYARAWMEPILRQMVLEQSNTKTEVIRKDTTPRAQ